MNCLAFRASYLAGEPGTGEHLRVCGGCRSNVSELETLRLALADPSYWENPPQNLEDRVVGAIVAEARPRGLTTGRRRRVFAVTGGIAVFALGIAIGQIRSGPPDWRVDLEAVSEGSVQIAGWNTPAGTRMELDVRGVPQRSDGTFYEVWMTSGDGLTVSAGTFRGPGEVTMWAGVARVDHPRIWITVEDDDGDPAPSWEVVFDT